MNFNESEARELAESLDRSIYHVYLLKKGPTWSGDPTPELDTLQKAHVANLRRLVDEGRLVLNGPLLDAFQLGGELRGIGVIKASSYQEACDLISTDPMVRAGHLAFEMHVWMVPKGVLP